MSTRVGLKEGLVRHDPGVVEPRSTQSPVHGWHPAAPHVLSTQTMR
ncbi:hypothetical protein [Thermofilum sp.]